MTLRITQLGIEVTGKITRNYDAATDKTTLVLNEAQVAEIYQAADMAMVVFYSDGHPKDTKIQGVRNNTPAVDAGEKMGQNIQPGGVA